MNMIISKTAFEAVVLAGVIGTALLLVLLVVYFVYELKHKKLW